MPASTPRWSSEGPTPTRPRQCARRERASPARPGDEGVSEVIGYLLVFGILAMVLVLSMSAFSTAKDGATGRVAEVRAESAAARVASIIVQTALLVEQEGTNTAVAYHVDLPDQLEALDYVVRIEPATAATVAGDCTPGAHSEQVCVRIPALDVSVTAPVFSAGASTVVDLCRIEVGGGPVYVRFNEPSDGSRPVPAGCVAATPRIFLEAA